MKHFLATLIHIWRFFRVTLNKTLKEGYFSFQRERLDARADVVERGRWHVRLHSISGHLRLRLEEPRRAALQGRRHHHGELLSQLYRLLKDVQVWFRSEFVFNCNYSRVTLVYAPSMTFLTIATRPYLCHTGLYTMDDIWLSLTKWKSIWKNI